MFAAVLLLALGWTGDSCSAAQRLFCIERSKNANVVCYDVCLKNDGSIDPSHPLDAYWILHAKKGQHEELSWLERRLAYGYEIVGDVKRTGFDFRLKAFPKRPIAVRRPDHSYLAETTLSHRPARLQSVYVATRESALVPKVLYVLIRGKDLRTGQELVERVVER